MEAILAFSIVSNFSDTYSNYYLENLRHFAENEIIQGHVKSAITLQYYNGPSVYSYNTYSLANGLDILKEPTYDNNKKTIVYLHGYSENAAAHASDESIDIIVKEFLYKTDINLIVANYGKLVWRKEDYSLNIEYIRAMMNVPLIGRHLGIFFKEFIKMCRCQERMHLIGFSLGAQVAHYLSKTVKQDGFTIERITGLDPARPYFENNLLKEHLDQTDAIFVDIVHSNRGDFGWSTHMGDADFWPNKGSWPQPYCQAISENTGKCAHYCSVYYYAASINNPYLFPARACSDEVRWQTGNCHSTNFIYFGYNAPVTRGDYYFMTSATYPYGTGMAGLLPTYYYYYPQFFFFA